MGIDAKIITLGALTVVPANGVFADVTAGTQSTI